MLVIWAHVHRRGLLVGCCGLGFVPSPTGVTLRDHPAQVLIARPPPRRAALRRARRLAVAAGVYRYPRLHRCPAGAPPTLPRIGFLELLGDARGLWWRLTLPHLDLETRRWWRACADLAVTARYRLSSNSRNFLVEGGGVLGLAGRAAGGTVGGGRRCCLALGATGVARSVSPVLLEPRRRVALAADRLFVAAAAAAAYNRVLVPPGVFRWCRGLYDGAARGRLSQQGRRVDASSACKAIALDDAPSPATAGNDGGAIHLWPALCFSNCCCSAGRGRQCRC